ncbi:MAG: hypothetical protein QM635_10505 [Microbacteriaceae bacterium]
MQTRILTRPFPSRRGRVPAPTRIAVGGLGMLLAASLSACQGTRAGTAAGTAAGTTATTADDTASPTATEAVSIAGDYSLCESLLSDSTRSALTEAGYGSSGSVWEQKVIEDQPLTEQYGGLSLARFVDRGGVVCGWQPVDGDLDGLILSFAYGPITEADTKAEKASIVTAGSTAVSDSVYTDDEGFPGGYQFGDGYWAYVEELGAETIIGSDDDGRALLAEIVGNTPAF